MGTIYTEIPFFKDSGDRMKVLSRKDTQDVSGGTYTVTVVANVPDYLNDWVVQTINQINGGKFPYPDGMYYFSTYLKNAKSSGITFGDIKVTTATFTNINSP